MRAFDVVRYAWSSLVQNRMRSGLILASMGIGVAGVVVLTWLGDSARRYVTGEFSALGTNLLIVLPGRTETTGAAPPVLGETARDLTIDDALALARSPAVTLVAPIVAGDAPVAHGGVAYEATILGSTPELFAIRHLQMGQGRPWSSGDPRQAHAVCVIGSTVKQEIFGPKRALGEWLRIGAWRFRVIGVLASKGRSLGNDLDEMVVVPVASAQALFDAPSLFRILVQARSREALQQAEHDIERIVRERHEGEADVTVITQESVLSTFDRIFVALTLSVGGIAAVSLLVAGILVMNVMVVAVSQRREEVGLLKALGAPPRQIQSLFLSEAALLSLVGAGCGLLLGVAAVLLVSRLYPQLGPALPLWAPVAAILVAVGSGVLFGVAPARRAAKLDPVQALARR